MTDIADHLPERSDPHFDGHLERPLDSMSVAERFRWLDEGARMLRWAEQVREQDRSTARP